MFVCSRLFKNALKICDVFYINFFFIQTNLISQKEEFQLYATYCKNKPNSEELRKELHQTAFLSVCIFYFSYLIFLYLLNMYV